MLDFEISELESSLEESWYSITKTGETYDTPGFVSRALGRHGRHVYQFNLDDECARKALSQFEELDFTNKFNILRKFSNFFYFIWKFSIIGFCFVDYILEA